jgi:hypothetical protein
MQAIRVKRFEQRCQESMMASMHEQKPAKVKLSGRIWVIGFGMALALLGMAMVKRGILVLLHWTHQPEFSWGLVAAGFFCIFAGVMPESWIVNATRVPPSKARQLESAPFHGRHHKKHAEEKQLD